MKSTEFTKQFFDEFEKKHGYRTPFQCQSVRKKTSIAAIERVIDALKMNEHAGPLFALDAEQLFDKGFKCMGNYFWWQCKDCRHVYAAQLISTTSEYMTICPFCAIEKASTMRNCSKSEVELAEFLKQELKGLKVINGNNKINRHIIPPYEIDIWLPDLNIGIEFDGTFWHSIEYAKKSKKSNYMYVGLKKTINCEKKRIHLIHVYEDEWLFKNQQTKELLIDIINGKNHFELNDDILEIPRSLYPSWTQIPGYEFIEFTLPKLQPRCNSKGKIYHVADCGNMIFKRI